MPHASLHRIVDRLSAAAVATPVDRHDSGTCGQLFKNLSPGSLEHLLSQARTHHYKEQEEIIRQGAEPHGLFLILSGQVKTVRYNANGQEATIRMLQPGETFMDAVIFMGGKSPINAVAVEDCSLLCIPATLVRAHVLSDPTFATNLLHIVTNHYKNAMQQIDNISIKTPVERLGHYLLRQHLEQDPDSMEFDLPFQKSMIASHLGMTPETFSRALGQIKKSGIDIDQKHIRLRDAFALCHFCDSDLAEMCSHAGGRECPNHDSCLKTLARTPRLITSK